MSISCISFHAETQQIEVIKSLPKTGIEPVSPRPQRGVLTTILLGPMSISCISFHAETQQIAVIKSLPKTGIEPVSPRPQRGVLTTILLGPMSISCHIVYI
ncbi:hypothetical protein DICVIV_07977 [Dictyocaulus viviparus]|uniref:Uncharacterized protein n=1 Tax=Dictyocaulus viviparus TaxID=29172 RepID=A0A0D8XUB1_DICVI|nr:hypothetical protein DICVIV_07977 [Dictyocaulus viviparus]